MYQLGHRLWLLIIQLVNEQIGGNSIIEGSQEDFVVYLIYQQGFPVKTADKNSKTLVLSLLYVQQARRGALMPIASDEVVNKQLA